MRFQKTEVDGAYLIEVDRFEDDRGFFARTWCRNEFAAHGLVDQVSQCSVSWNRRRGTVRGMHYQIAPDEEVKVVRCTHGAVYDVVIDLRPRSATYLRWAATELSDENHRMFYVPAGCAHGFQTLRDHCELFYQISGFHAPENARGLRWNDPAFGVVWPLPVEVISTRDAEYADYQPASP